MRVRLAHVYILTVYSYFESFLKSVKDKKQYAPAINWTRRADEPLVDFIVRSTGLDSDEESEIFIKILTYFRLARNKFTHVDARDQKLSAAYKDLVKAIKAVKPLGYIPNPPEQIQYSDFQYFTRTVKKVSDRILEISGPTAQQVKDLILDDLKRFKGFRSNEKKWSGAITQLLFTKYSLNKTDAAAVIAIC